MERLLFRSIARTAVLLLLLHHLGAVRSVASRNQRARPDIVVVGLLDRAVADRQWLLLRALGFEVVVERWIRYRSALCCLRMRKEQLSIRWKEVAITEAIRCLLASAI